MPLTAAIGAGTLRAFGPWQGWEPGLWAVAATTVTVLWHLSVLARMALDSALFHEVPRWDYYAHAEVEIGEVRARDRHAVMQRSRQRVEEFSRTHNLVHVSLGIPAPTPHGYIEASTLQVDGYRHVSIGHRWLNRGSRHLPAILEHELAHLRRRDALRRLIRRAAGSGLAVAAAWHGPVPAAAVVCGALLMAGVVAGWWSELACDRAAQRSCGPVAAAAMWREQIEEDRDVPLLRRWTAAVLSLSSHPPLRLRMWLASCGRSCGGRARDGQAASDA
ncbi:hypothetical protein [Kitasatospora sp. NPDC058046]|uniref:hypothetical protein n=1 Tax=Kitasatospora sp. NPDC058046 TaxID=3346312 RepID=UPI0036DCDF1C